jgi:hypothetical protein
MEKINKKMIVDVICHPIECNFNSEFSAEFLEWKMMKDDDFNEDDQLGIEVPILRYAVVKRMSDGKIMNLHPTWYQVKFQE